MNLNIAICRFVAGKTYALKRREPPVKVAEKFIRLGEDQSGFELRYIDDFIGTYLHKLTSTL